MTNSPDDGFFIAISGFVFRIGRVDEHEWAFPNR